MYTENDYENNDFDEYNDEQQEVYEESFWDRNKGLIFKIIIIILCVLILIWLVSKLGKNNKVESNYDSNVTAVRLAAEQYFFINNKPSNQKESISVSELESRNLVKDVKDANGNACNSNNSVVTLENNTINYIMSVKLDCGKDNETRNYYYRLDNYACDNCNGNTYMDGTNGPSNNEEDEPVDPNLPNNYTCDWSDWTTVRDYTTGLDERTRVVVKAQKQNTKEEIVYGEWSEYSTEVIEGSDDLEVQSKTQVTENWVPMTSSTAVTASSTIRNVQKHTSGGSRYTYCPSGYEKYDGRCRKSNGATRNLTPTEYLGLSGEERKSCRQTRPTANKVVWVCGGGYSYTDLKTGYTSGSTTYSYEQLEKTEQTVYRSRTKDIKVTILEPTVTDYILKTDVPSGYTIVPGSERTEYSYKLSSCGTK